MTQYNQDRQRGQEGAQQEQSSGQQNWNQGGSSNMPGQQQQIGRAHV